MKSISLIIIILISTNAFGQSVNLMDSIVSQEIDSLWMEKQGINSLEIVSQNDNIYCLLETQKGYNQIRLSETNAVSILSIRVWRSAQQSKNKALLYFSIQNEMSHAWGGGGLGNKFEEVVIVDLKKLESVFQFIPNWHYGGSEGNEEYMISWDCHYQSEYHFSDDSLWIKNIRILAAEKMEEDYSQAIETESETKNDPDCHPKLAEGLYLYDGNTFVKQGVEEEDK